LRCFLWFLSHLYQLLKLIRASLNEPNTSVLNNVLLCYGSYFDSSIGTLSFTSTGASDFNVLPRSDATLVSSHPQIITASLEGLDEKMLPFFCGCSYCSSTHSTWTRKQPQPFWCEHEEWEKVVGPDCLAKFGIPEAHRVEEESKEADWKCCVHTACIKTKAYGSLIQPCVATSWSAFIILA